MNDAANQVTGAETSRRSVSPIAINGLAARRTPDQHEGIIIFQNVEAGVFQSELQVDAGKMVGLIEGEGWLTKFKHLVRTIDESTRSSLMVETG